MIDGNRLAKNTDRRDWRIRVRAAPTIFHAGCHWKLWRDTTLRAPQEQVDIDQHLLDEVFREHLPPVIRIWKNQRALVLARSDLRLPGVPSACDVFRASGLPVLTRSSGGTVVMHGPGILNISLVHSLNTTTPDIAGGYRLLCGFTGSLLEGLGIAAHTAAVPGAFCDGRYNLVVGGRKIAGTAQRVKWLNGRLGVLSHLCLLVANDCRQMVRTLQSFYDTAGVPVELAGDVITSVAQASGQKGVEKALESFIGSLCDSTVAALN